MKSTSESEANEVGRFWYVDVRGGCHPTHVQLSERQGRLCVLDRAEAPPREPLSAQFVLGRKKPGAVIWSTGNLTPIASQALLDALREASLTGFIAHRVELLGKLAPWTPYYLLAITGRCGPHWFGDRSAPGWDGRGKGIHFRPETWDGSDLFVPKPPGFMHVFCTERFRSVVLGVPTAAQGIEFTRLADREFVGLSDRPPPYLSYLDDDHD